MFNYFSAVGAVEIMLTQAKALKAATGYNMGLPVLTIAELLDQYLNDTTDKMGTDYLRFHLRRYQELIGEVADALRGHTGRPSILDIGMAYQTVCLLHLIPNAELHTAGFFDKRFDGVLDRDRHTEFDLNEARLPERIPTGIGEHDVVVLAEVIEHVYIPASYVLKSVASWLKPGGTLILQTPNPVSLGKRIAAVKGINPFEMIREYTMNPGHFCEFTVEDIRAAVESAGLVVTSIKLQNYFGRHSRLYNALCTILPGNLHDGITLCARKP